MAHRTGNRNIDYRLVVFTYNDVHSLEANNNVADQECNNYFVPCLWMLYYSKVAVKFTIHYAETSKSIYKHKLYLFRLNLTCMINTSRNSCN